MSGKLEPNLGVGGWNPSAHSQDRMHPPQRPAQALLHSNVPSSPHAGIGGNREPSGSFVDAREGSPSHPPVRCLWTSCLASLDLRLLIYKTGINMPISQACSELADEREIWIAGVEVPFPAPVPTSSPFASQRGPRRAHLHGR